MCDTRAEAHESCSRAQEHCVNIDGNSLHKTLLGRMRDIRGCGGIRSRTYARLIGEKTSLDAENHAGTGDTAEDGLKIESVR